MDLQTFLDKYLMLLIPILVVQLALMAAGLIDVLRREPGEVSGGKRWIWVLIIMLVNLVGPLIYFIFGRKGYQSERD